MPQPKPVSEFRALGFDCFGTLIDWESGIVSALAPLAARARPQPGPGQQLTAFSGLESAEQAKDPAARYPVILERVHQALAARWGVEGLADEARRFGASIGAWPPFDDTVAALRYLKRHFKLVALSNVDRDSFARTNQALEVEFDRIITAEEVGAYKPDPAMFDALVREVGRLGVAPDRLLHVAQSRFHDIAPATRHGLATAWVDRAKRFAGDATPLDPTGTEPTYRVTDLAELVEMHRIEKGSEA